ncbi:Serine/threonine-protein phosphatase 2 [compost metagenome]
MIKHYPKNTKGRDFAVGDIHGHFTKLQKALDSIGFDPLCDRLFSVGDLVDRGPECRDALEWLDKPWFHAVRGNHDDYVCRFDTCNSDNWVYNGGSWFAGLAWDEQQEFATQFRELPFAIEVETDAGLVGIVHAECGRTTWAQFRAELLEPIYSLQEQKNMRNTAMWSRKRIDAMDRSGTPDLRAMIVGHETVDEVTWLGNVAYIDTGGHRNGNFTLLALNTLTHTKT